MRSAQLVTLLDSSTADAITVSIIKPVLRVSGDPSVVVDHRYIYMLKVSQLKDILQALRDAHGPCIQFRICSTTGNKELLVQRVLMALYPQHASVILSDRGLNAPASNAQSDSRPPNAHPMPGQMLASLHHPVSSFAAIPPMNGTNAISGPTGSFHAASLQPSTSPRVQVHLRAAGAPAASSQFPARVPITTQPSVVSPLLKEAVSRWSHPMFQPLAFETFVFTHPVSNFQGALPFDKPQSPESVEKILIVPFTRRGIAGSSNFVPFQLQPGISVAVSWNNCAVEIPKFVNVKSKLAAATIHPHPMFVPQSAPFFKCGPNRLVMTGGGAENVFGVAVILVRPRRLEDLEALVRSHPMSKILNRPEFNQDDDCAATSTPVQLKDPLSFCRIQIPVKTVKCKHVQCFDLATFIQYCERNGICKPGLSIYDVYVDQFFLDMIKDASAHDTNTVYLKPDGSWTTTDPDTAPAPPSLPAPPSNPAPSQPPTQRVRVFPDGIQGSQSSWLFELPVGSTVKSLKAAIEARTSHRGMQCQLPRELFILNWHERKIYRPEARHQGQSAEDSSTPPPIIINELKEIPAQDDDQVRVFGPSHASQELALQNEAFYSMKWLIDRKHARAFLSFRLSPTKAEELYSILNLLVDELNSNVDSEWLKNPSLSLSDHDLKLLAAFAPSSQQDMQALLPQKSPEFWATYHQIFLKSILDYHQLGRNRLGVSALAASQATTQPRGDVHNANGLAARAAAMPAGESSNRGDLNAPQSTSHTASAAISNPALRLSRVIGQQDAADRLRAAAEWLDSRSDNPCSVELLAAINSLPHSRDSVADDDLPLVPPPQHLAGPGWNSDLVDSRPSVAHAVHDPSTRPLGSGSGQPRIIESRPENQQRTVFDSRRLVGQLSIGQKRPAPNSLGSSASNAIVIDDD